jgi:hypothetical protein
VDISIKKRENYEDNSEDIKEKRRRFYEDNRERITEERKISRHTREGKSGEILSSAKRREIIVELTREDIMNITDFSCFYCGMETVDGVKRNSIDRMVNSIGYTSENSVSCCEKCNYMKKCLDARTFVDRCCQISLMHFGIGRPCHHWTENKFISYERYQQMLKTDFQLTEEEYYKIRENSCSYCGRPSTDNHSNGIDRIDSKIGYIADNCVSCCGDCNISKSTLSPNEFIIQAKQITSVSGEKDWCDTMPREIKIINFREKHCEM